FQAEDGIRVFHVTGVQTCALPICEMAATGMMHNRVRMVVASFLVKDLHLPWQRGADHFRRMLVDYDHAQNQLNWQWVAATGTDADRKSVVEGKSGGAGGARLAKTT